MGSAYTRSVLFLAEGDLVRKICAQKGRRFCIDRSIHGQHRREADNIVPPECSPDLWQVGFVKKVAITRRLQIDAANLNVDRVFLRCNQQIRAVGAQLPADLVADVGRHCDHRSGNRDTQGDSDSSQQFAPLLPPERFVEEAREHNLRPEHAASRRYVRFLDDDGVAGGLGL